MLKTKLLETLAAHDGDDFHYTADREYHDPVEIMDIIREVLENAGDEINELEDLRDCIMEFADSATPVYNYDLAKWFGENYQAYNDISDELGKDGMGDDIMRGIAIAYCMTLEREAEAALIVLWEEAEEMGDDDAAEAGNKMNFFKMYLRNIESDRQSFTAFISKSGYVENLGQPEYSNFREKVNCHDNLTASEKAELCARYTEMLTNL